jgi:hypothetical protein
MPALRPSGGAWFVDLPFRRRLKVTIVHAAWLLAYIPTVILYATDQDIRFCELWPFLIPIMIAVLQVIHETLCGWIVIFVPSCVYTGFGFYYLASSVLKKQWTYDWAGFCFGTFFTFTYFLICVLLLGCYPGTKVRWKA